ncbi:hypothetical protein ACP26L_36195 (plasmid) [Paenibacillus sp. S-38]|uniref:hypothetical protein n=1 Tax=Paenibacillus sp. S-38 TaxID=3416710 RepID=UPI003CED2D12
MKAFKRLLFLCSVFCFLLIGASAVSAKDLNFYYPGTTNIAKAGDIIIAPSWDWQTSFVGHVGIIDDEGYVIDVRRNGTNKLTRVSYSSWVNTFEDFQVVRIPNNTIAEKSAAWAKSKWSSNYSFTYQIGNRLDDFSKNYCSKFIAQAIIYGGMSGTSYYLGSFSQPTVAKMSGSDSMILYPDAIADQWYIFQESAGTFPIRQSMLPIYN